MPERRLCYFTMGDHFSALGLEFVFTSTDLLFSFIYLLVFALITFFFALRAMEQSAIPESSFFWQDTIDMKPLVFYLLSSPNFSVRNEKKRSLYAILVSMHVFYEQRIASVQAKRQ